MRSLIPFMRLILMTHHLPRAPPLNPITLGCRISTQGFVRDRNDQTILFSLVQEETILFLVQEDLWLNFQGLYE